MNKNVVVIVKAAYQLFQYLQTNFILGKNSSQVDQDFNFV